MAASIASLSVLRREDAVDFGGKAANLGELIHAGLPVPPGYALTGVPDPHEERDLVAILAQNELRGVTRFAVRSSAIGEDGGKMSYAGQFESKLNVRPEHVYVTLRGLAHNIPARVFEYDPDFKPENLRFIVQAMVPAVRAGVLFTEDPADPSQMAVEMVDGLGDKLVSGEVTPESYTLPRSGSHLWELVGDQTNGHLWKIGLHVEEIFASPQDIEFAIDQGGKLWLLQARPITA